MERVEATFTGCRRQDRRLAPVADTASAHIIRPLKSGDQSQLGDLYASTAGPSLDFLMTLGQQPTTCCWVLRGEASVIGACWFACVQGEAELIDFLISPKHRRRGFGALLLTGCLEQLTEDAVFSCHLEVRRSNKAAIGLYHKAGFITVGERPNYYHGNPEAEDAILMRWQADERPLRP